VVVGWLLAGPLGAVIAVAGWGAAMVAGGRLAGMAAALLFTVAAAETVLKGLGGAGAVTAGFADDRPIAALAARAAGILGIVALVDFSIRERAVAPIRRSRSRRSWSPLRRAGAGVVVVVAVVPLLVGAVVLHASTGWSPAIPEREVVANLELGRGFLRGSPASPTAVYPPLPLVLAAFSPLGPTGTKVLLGIVTTAVVARLAHRFGGSRAAIVAACAAVVLPSVWGQPLAGTAAACAVAIAAVLAWPSALTPARAAGVGFALGAAVLAAPAAALAAPAIVVWTWLGHRGGRLTAVAVAALALTVAPWQLWVADHLGTAVPSTQLGSALAAATDASGAEGPMIGAPAPVAVPPPGTAEVDADRLLRRTAWSSGRLLPGPIVALARAARAWDLWPPGSTSDARCALGAGLPGGAVGVALEVSAVGLALGGAWRHRRRARTLFPLIVIPALFTVLSLGLYGDRDLRAWVAPVVAVWCGVAAVPALRQEP